MSEPKYYDDVKHDVEEKKKIVKRNTCGKINQILGIKESDLRDDYWLDDDYEDEWWDNYSRAVSAAYFAEEEEMKLGIHPTQTRKERTKNNGRKN